MRILCYGDSNTWGYNPENALRFRHRWTAELASLLPDDEIIEEGLNGRNLCREDPDWPGRNGITILPVLLRTHRPVDLVIVMLGSNDLKSCHDVDEKILARDMEKTIEIIQNDSLAFPYTPPKTLLISPVELGDEILTTSPWRGEFNKKSYLTSKAMSGEFKKVAVKYDVHFLDAAEFAHPSHTDGLHLDEENHRRLAEAVAAKINGIRF